MLTIDGLRAYGANVEEGLARCMNNETFYMRLVKMSLEESGFQKLPEAVQANDLKAAFEAAHALKGVLGNLALTPLLTPVAEITELLRNRQEMDYAPYLTQIAQQLEKLRELCAE
jgi:HPt (histidine-containing phosphotransfer) domain-containing protein